MLPCAMSLQRTCILPENRLRGLSVLCEVSKVPPEQSRCIEECIARNTFFTPRKYILEIKRIAFNIKCNPSLMSESAERLSVLSDGDLAAGTLVEKVKKEEAARTQAFNDMLVERYENVKKQAVGDTVLRCRQCNSSDIHMTQKQTRSGVQLSPFQTRPDPLICSCVFTLLVLMRSRRRNDHFRKVPVLQS